jgi:hypothetical protein
MTTLRWSDLAIANRALVLGSSITPVGNGWYRFSITGANNSTGNVYATLDIRSQGDGSTGFGVGNENGTSYIWGAQLETGTSATSYIPTVASQVTRAADVSSSSQATRAADNTVMTGTGFSSWYRQDEGTAVCTSDSKSTSTAHASLFAFYDSGASVNLVDAWHQSDEVLVTRVRANSQDNIVTTPAVLVDNVKHTMSIGYKSANNYFINNGINGVSNSTPFSFTNTIANLALGMNQIGTWQMNGHITKFAYYPKRLTNSELQGLTTT